jgi:5-formyltetrahydrofolate cyclo-ligase
MSVEKRAIRQALRAERRRQSAAIVTAAGAAVCAQLLGFPLYRAATSVAAYVADENEIPTAPVIEDALRAGRRVYLPRDFGVPGFVRWHPDIPLRRARGGVQEPVDGVPEGLEPPAIVLLPAVAWDDTGTRLGRGGGFYDRLLTKLDPRIVRVGLAYEFQRFPELPRDPWDVSMHYVITERRVVACDNSRGAPAEKGGLQQ